jgi:hypothetical protein
MGQVKKQYQDWVEQHIPQEIAKEVNEAWTQQFEQFIQQLMNTKFKEENKDE